MDLNINHGNSKSTTNTAELSSFSSSHSSNLSTNTSISCPSPAYTTSSKTTSTPHEPPISPALPSPDAPAGSRTTLQITLIMVALCTAVFLAALDTVILTTALPTIAADLHASTSGFAWVGSSFLLANATSMPFWGQASDIFGRKPLLLLANGVFMLGSLVSALAPNLTALLAGRAVQGLGAGGLTVLVNIIVSDLFSLRRRGLMLALVGSVWSFASTIGPVTGGALAQKVSWRWCFWVNPSLLLLTTLLRLHTPHTPLLHGLAALDWLGGITLITGTLSVLTGLDLGGSTFPWSSPAIILLLIIGILLLSVFILIEYRFATHPIMPLSRILSGRSSNAATLGVCTAHGACYISVAYFLPLYFQSVLGFSPLESGTWSLVMAGTLLLATLGAGVYMHATGRYLEIVYFGLGFLVLGFGLFTTLPATLDVPRVVTFQVVMCLGVGALFQPPLVALQAHLENADVAMGTATFGFVRMLTAGFSIVIGQVIFQTGMRGREGEFIDAGIQPAMAKGLVDGMSLTAGAGDGLTKVQLEVVRIAQTQSLSRMWMFYTAIAAVGVLAGLGIKRREMSKLHVETKTGLESMTSQETSLLEDGIGGGIEVETRL